ncbi:MAG: PhoD-like phosphatase N-terminal domain-containing protein, partial [Lacisediminimonas sp.]|nr:PhoD-like phosphatase N-terminal domain-containing protein [Lacisediminimonas sp.]
MMKIHRREFLRHAAQLSAVSALSLAFPGAVLSRTPGYPFGLGVASGAPLPDRIMLWTRLVPEGIVGDPLPPAPVRVKWEIAENEQFSKIVQRGEATALPQ